MRPSLCQPVTHTSVHPLCFLLVFESSFVPILASRKCITAKQQQQKNNSNTLVDCVIVLPSLAFNCIASGANRRRRMSGCADDAFAADRQPAASPKHLLLPSSLSSLLPVMRRQRSSSHSITIFVHRDNDEDTDPDIVHLSDDEDDAENDQVTKEEDLVIGSMNADEDDEDDDRILLQDPADPGTGNDNEDDDDTEDEDEAAPVGLTDMLPVTHHQDPADAVSLMTAVHQTSSQITAAHAVTDGLVPAIVSTDPPRDNRPHWIREVKQKRGAGLQDRPTLSATTSVVEEHELHNVRSLSIRAPNEGSAQVQGEVRAGRKRSSKQTKRSTTAGSWDMRSKLRQRMTIVDYRMRSLFSRSRRTPTASSSRTSSEPVQGKKRQAVRAVVKEQTAGREEDSSDWSCPVCCTSREGPNLIWCDTCHHWFHYTCVGVKRNPPDPSWYCPSCR